MSKHVDDYPALTAKAVHDCFRRAGFRGEGPFATFAGRLELSARSLDAVTVRYALVSRRQTGEEMTATVLLSWTPCRFGGRRMYFLCPHCGRRVAVLRLTWQGPACRHCIGAGYVSQSLCRLDRLMTRACRAKEKIAGGKPKWMHRKTFASLTAEEQRLRIRAIQASCAFAKAETERIRMEMASGDGGQDE